MAKVRARYNYTTESGLDTYYFETDDQSIKILDVNKNEVGTLKEFGFEGKIVNSGSFTDLRVSGLYKVKGLTGLPSGYAVDKISILSVKAVGAINNPEMVFYTLISTNGEVYQNTVVGTSKSGWVDGGVNLDNIIKNLTKSIGDNSQLKTAAKVSLVNSINELSDKIGANQTGIVNLLDDLNTFKGHNHDNAYIIKSGDEMKGHLAVTNDRYIRGKSANNNETYDLLGTTSSNNIVVGDSSRPLYLRGSDLLNKDGEKVWHGGNDGVGSGLDADLLDGRHGSEYAQLDKHSIFTNTLQTKENMYIGRDIVFGDDWNSRKARIRHFSDGSVTIGESEPLRIGSDSGVKTTGDVIINSANRWAGVRFTLTGSKGLGFERDRNHGYLVLHDWDKGKTGFRFDGDTGKMEFPAPIEVQGRQLFMQSSDPGNSAPNGSIWIS